jgi:lysozyme
MLNAVIDLSHHNGTVDFGALPQAEILGVIHKATEGVSFVDPLYATNRAAATASGFWWGAYHFGTGGDGVAQAEFFLNAVQPGQNHVLVLDFEANGQRSSMSLAEAAAFVTHIQKTTGRWPGLYGGHYLKGLLGNRRDPVLANCWLWLSQYGPTPVVPSNWETWTLWQYTDGRLGPPPHEVAGLGPCDRDRFNGDLAGLKLLWGIT